MSIFELIYLLGWIAAESSASAPYATQVDLRAQLGESASGSRDDLRHDRVLRHPGAATILHFHFWLGSADYSLPAWGGSLGTILFIGCLLLLWRAHSDLGENWSARIELQQEHTLVTRGVYARVRHPIYAALWLWCFAQPLLIQNWIGGFAGLATFALLYFTRVPGEEKLMLDAFGEEYRIYMRNTGRVLPRF
jgi:protein-S-isoprenylcysteine O-methyltransferase Ste14